MKQIKLIATIFSALMMVVSCYPKNELNPDDWYTVLPEGTIIEEDEVVEGLMVMSSNVRFYSARNKADDPDTGTRDWEVRKEGYFLMINTMQPDVFGVQEAENIQLNHIKDNCPGYSYVGVGRKDGVTDGESTAIFYKTSLIEVESWGTKWMSKTPDVVNSYFASNLDRQARTSTWAILKVRETGERFFIINNHTSLYEESQTEEVQLIVKLVEELCPAGLPVVLTGDWNLEEADSIMKPVNDSYLSARKTATMTDNYLTFHWWGSRSTISQNKHLDHIFYKGFDRCYRFRTLNMQWKNLWISDHHPVYAILQFHYDAQ